MSAAAGVVEQVTRPVSGLLGSLGVSDESTRRALSGGALFGFPGALAGREVGRTIEEQRAQAEAASEAERQQFNEEVFRLAQSISGRVGQADPSVFENLQFAGADPRQQQLTNLLNVFQQRRQELTQRQDFPGLSQTRLSLVQ